MIEAPLWTAPFEGALPAPEAPLPHSTDVAIVGAGYTGLSAALALQHHGFETCVLEAERVGFGASSRNGGMALTGLKAGPRELLQRFGAQRARAFFDASLRALETLERIVADESIDCSYARYGHLEVACTPKHAQAFAHAGDLYAREFDHPVRTLGRDELASEIGSSAYYGGLLDLRSGGLDPYRYVQGLARAAHRHGATIAEHAPVFEARPDGGGWRVRTARGELSCTHLIVATGGYTTGVFARLQRRIVPLGSYVIATEPLPDGLATTLLPTGRMVFNSRRLLHYFRLTQDSRMLFGGRAAFVPANETTTRTSARMLQAAMVEVFPQLRDVAVDYAWGGRLDVTFDVMPHAGTLDGYSYATGYAGHGVALATYLGELVANTIAEGRAPEPFDDALPRAPLRLYDGRAWFLPLVGAWERFLDMVN